MSFSSPGEDVVNLLPPGAISFALETISFHVQQLSVD